MPEKRGRWSAVGRAAVMPDFTIAHHYVCTSVDSPGSVGGYIQEFKYGG